MGPGGWMAWSPLSEPVAPRRSRTELAIDGAATVLFAVFVGALYLGFVDSGFPYATFAAFPLTGSLAIVFWGNLRADRFVRSHPGVEDT